MHFITILGHLSIWIILLPLFLGLYYYRHLDSDSKLILLIVIIGAIPQLLKSFDCDEILMNVLYNVYTPIEFFVYWLMFGKRIVSRDTKTIKNITLIVFVSASVIITYRYGWTDKFRNEWVVVNNLAQITWVCLCLLEYYRNDNAKIETRQPFFWFISGITTYASCTVIFYGLWQLIKSDQYKEYQLLKIVHHVFNILIYCLFSIGILKNKPRTTSVDPSP